MGSMTSSACHLLMLPSLGFLSALDALKADVCTICELPEADAEKLKVRGVTVTNTNDVTGMVITALKSLKTAQSPLVLNTPHLTEEPYGEGGDAPLLETSTLDRLHSLLLEAEGYVNGERAQATLFPATEESATQEQEVSA